MFIREYLRQYLIREYIRSCLENIYIKMINCIVRNLILYAFYVNMYKLHIKSVVDKQMNVVGNTFF